MTSNGQRIDIVADDERVEELAVAFAHEQAPPFKPLKVDSSDTRRLLRSPQPETDARQVTQERQEDAQRRHALLPADDIHVVAAGVLYEHNRTQGNSRRRSCATRPAGH